MEIPMNWPQSRTFVTIWNGGDCLNGPASRSQNELRNELKLECKEQKFDKGSSRQNTSRGSKSKTLKTNIYESERAKGETDLESVWRTKTTIGFPPLAKAKSAESLRGRQELTTGVTEKENRAKKPNSGTIRNPLDLNMMKAINVEQEKLFLPPIQPLKLQNKRRSFSLEELSINQKLNLQKILKEHHPTYVIDDAFWSTHWLETRSLLQLNTARQSLQYESQDTSSRDAETIENRSIQDSDIDLPSTEINDPVPLRSQSIQVVLSLEERLLLIEQLHGIDHKSCR